VLLVTANVMHCAVIYFCCHSGLRGEYVSVAIYCSCNALRSDTDLLPYWTTSAIGF